MLPLKIVLMYENPDLSTAFVKDCLTALNNPAIFNKLGVLHLNSLGKVLRIERSLRGMTVAGADHATRKLCRPVARTDPKDDIFVVSTETGDVFLEETKIRDAVLGDVAFGVVEAVVRVADFSVLPAVKSPCDGRQQQQNDQRGFHCRGRRKDKEEGGEERLVLIP